MFLSKEENKDFATGEAWTTEATVDELYRCLVTTYEIITVNQRTLPLKKYQRRAMEQIKLPPPHRTTNC